MLSAPAMRRNMLGLAWWKVEGHEKSGVISNHPVKTFLDQLICQHMSDLSQDQQSHLANYPWHMSKICLLLKVAEFVDVSYVAVFKQQKIDSLINEA